MDVRDLPLVAGHPALDLINTRERGSGAGSRDFLATGTDLAVWAERAELIPAGAVEPVGDRALVAITLLREALHHVVLSLLGQGDGDPQEDLDLLQQCWGRAMGRSRLRLERPKTPIQISLTSNADNLIEDRLAEAALTLLTGPEVARIRRCPIDQGGCGWVFLDRTRNGSRTWCRMADCGNTVKAARLTARRRQQRQEQRRT